MTTVELNAKINGKKEEIMELNRRIREASELVTSYENQICRNIESEFTKKFGAEIGAKVTVTSIKGKSIDGYYVGFKKRAVLDGYYMHLFKCRKNGSRSKERYSEWDSIIYGDISSVKIHLNNK